MFKFLRRTALWIVAVPLLCWTLGLASNQAVLVANHDTFPVLWNEAKVNLYRYHAQKTVEAGSEDAEDASIKLALLEHGYLDNTHVLMTHDTKLNFLADWIDLRDATYSLGDFLLYAGSAGLEYSPIIWCVVVIGRLRKKED